MSSNEDKSEMSSSEDNIQKPGDEHFVNVVGRDEPIKLFMSFGMLTELATAIPDVDALGQLFVHPETRNEVFKILVSERDEKGAITVEHTPHTMPMTTAEAGYMMKWAHRHLAHYFIDALQSMESVAGALQGVMQKMISSLGITEDSASETPPASPSE